MNGRAGRGPAIAIAAAVSALVPAALAQPASNEATAPPSTGAPPPSTGAPPPVTGAPPPVTDPSRAPLEVTVRGEPPPAPDRPSPKQSRLVPGAFGDAIRAVEALPGVAATASGLPYFYVRGAPPASSGYFIDGIPVPLLFHIGPGASIVSPGAVERVDFFPGSAPARYGSHLGGVIAAETTSPSDTRRVELGIRSFDANALVESPVGDDTWALVAGRYGYPNLLLHAIGSTVSLDYWDYSLRVVRRLAARDSLSVFAFGADDRLHDDARNTDLFLVGAHRVDLRYDRRLDHGSFRLATTIGYDRTGEGAPGQPVASEVSSLGPRLRAEWDVSLGERVAVRAGATLSGAQARYDYATQSGSTISLAPHVDAAAGAYADVSLRVLPRLEMSPGVRADVYDSDGTTLGAVDPRLALRYEASDSLAWKATASMAHELPTYLVPAPGLDFDVSNGLQRALSLSLGSELSLPAFFLSVTGFYTSLDNATDYVSSCGQRDYCSIVGRVAGKTYGAELLVRRPLSRRLSGWIAYTLSRAERSAHGVEYLSPFDRTQVFSGVLSYNIGAGFRAGTRATYYSGRPELPALRTPGSTETAVSFRPGGAPQRRLPDFYRLDVRADKTWFIGSSGARVSLVLELFNATLTKEAYDWECDFTGSCTARMVGPIALPSLGIEGAL